MAQKPPRKPSSARPRVAGRQGPPPKTTAPTEPDTAPEVAPTETDTAPEVASMEPDTVATDTVATEPEASSTPRGKARPVSRVSTLRPSASAEDASQSWSHPGSSTKARSPRRIGWTPAIVMAVAAVVLGVFALIAGLHPGAKIGDNKAFIDAPATTELTSQVQSKSCALTVDNLDVDTWAKDARTVLTGQALADFDKYLPQQKEVLNQTKAVADCRVESVGVSFLSGGGDGATARVLTNLIVSQSVNGIAQGSAAARYQFGMERHGDQWLIATVEGPLT